MNVFALRYQHQKPCLRQLFSLQKFHHVRRSPITWRDSRDTHCQRQTFHRCRRQKHEVRWPICRERREVPSAIIPDCQYCGTHWHVEGGSVCDESIKGLVISQKDTKEEKEVESSRTSVKSSVGVQLDGQNVSKKKEVVSQGRSYFFWLSVFQFENRLKVYKCTLGFSIIFIQILIHNIISSRY